MRSHARKSFHAVRPESFGRREWCDNLPRQPDFCTTSQNGHPTTRPAPLAASDSRPTTSDSDAKCATSAFLKRAADYTSGAKLRSLEREFLPV